LKNVWHPSPASIEGLTPQPFVPQFFDLFPAPQLKKGMVHLNTPLPFKQIASLEYYLVCEKN
jgi:hypothetical protein